MSLLLEDEKPAPKAPLPAVSRLGPGRRLDAGLALAGAVVAVLILLDLGGPALAPVTMVGCLVLPGWVLIRRIPDADPLARAVFTIVASAAIFTILSLAMVWTGVWQPRPVAAAVLLAASALIMAVPAPAAVSTRRPLDWRGAWRLEDLRHRSLSSNVPWAVLAVAMVLWGVALALTGDELHGDKGLLTTFPVLWYFAAAGVAALCIWGVAARRMASTAFLAASFTGLVAVLYASAAMVVSVPRLPWSYKHIAVTNYIGATGQVDATIDIYNRWPGFFSVSAFLGEVAGYRDAVGYASLAEFSFALLDVAIVLAIVRTLSSNPRIYWTATLVFALTNWVNQNYYSPQAFSYTLYLTMCLVALTFLRSAPVKFAAAFEGRLGRLQRRSGRRRAAVAGAEAPVPAAAMVVPAAVALLVLQAVAVASHQLTPYLACLALAPLFVFGYFRPKWLAPALALVAIAYLLPNLDYVANKYGLFSGFDVVKNASYDVPQDLPFGDISRLMTRSPDALSLLIGVLGLAGFVRNVLRGNVRQTLIVAWLAAAPVFWLMVQSYGGEAKFRVYLFALPFLAVGAAWLFWSGPLRTRKAALGATAALTAMAVLFTVAYFQSEAKFRVQKTDVVAAEWLDGQVQPKDAIFQTSAFFPLLIGPNYPSYLEWGRLTSLTKLIQSSDYQLTAAEIEQYAHKNWNPDRVFVVFSDSQLAQVTRDKLFDADKLPALERQLASANNVDKVFNNGAVRIYQIQKTG
ncbi:hypothetical protein [Arthrobacter sp. B3I4]|uniref:hypothetical protein n=1 Tax=Arthrobacter sp. B3I4 TaxID=3042267 RepID=UPI0027876C00|nr:hypothetical protein [Arthrobacter sp. B3I4]MDQ0755120.1 hypothetical protein [Arthrobacter sp. B3I4]